jgi:hypothetical protein
MGWLNRFNKTAWYRPWEETKEWSDIKDKFIYFYRIKVMNKKKPYCVRCSSIIGYGHIEKKLNHWNGFWICDWCLKQKLAGQRNGVDLEDLNEQQIEKVKTESQNIKDKLSQVCN